MNTQVNLTNFKNFPINKKFNDKNIIIDIYLIDNKDLSLNQEQMNSLFKVINREKETLSQHNNTSYMNRHKNSNKIQ